MRNIVSVAALAIDNYSGPGFRVILVEMTPPRATMYSAIEKCTAAGVCQQQIIGRIMHLPRLFAAPVWCFNVKIFGRFLQ